MAGIKSKSGRGVCRGCVSHPETRCIVHLRGTSPLTALADKKRSRSPRMQFETAGDDGLYGGNATKRKPQAVAICRTVRPQTILMGINEPPAGQAHGRDDRPTTDLTA